MPHVIVSLQLTSPLLKNWRVRWGLKLNKIRMSKMKQQSSYYHKRSDLFVKNDIDSSSNPGLCLFLMTCLCVCIMVIFQFPLSVSRQFNFFGLKIFHTHMPQSPEQAKFMLSSILWRTVQIVSSREHVS